MTFWGGDYVLKRTVVMLIQLCKYTKIHSIVYFKWVNCICELHHNNAVTTKKEPPTKTATLDCLQLEHFCIHIALFTSAPLEKTDKRSPKMTFLKGSELK